MTTTFDHDELYREMRGVAQQVMRSDMTTDDIAAMLIIFYRIIARKTHSTAMGQRPRLVVVPPPDTSV